MAEIKKAIDINAPLEKVFDYVADASNALTFMPNFTRFEPLGLPRRGLGAKVSAAGTFFGMQFKTQLEIIEFEENQRFVSRSTQGVKSLTTWEFRSLADGGTEVTFTSQYSMPGGMLGRLFDGAVVAKDVEKNTIQTLVNLKKVLENNPRLKAVDFASH